MREAAHDLEDPPVFAANPELTITLLQLRRSEKDWILRLDPADAEEARNVNAQLKSQIRALNISASEKTELLDLADKYLTNFDAMVALDQKISSGNEALLTTAQLAQTQAEKFVGITLDERDQALASHQSATDVSGVLSIATLALALIAGAGMAYLIARLLARQVAEIERVLAMCASASWARAPRCSVGMNWGGRRMVSTPCSNRCLVSCRRGKTHAG
jgi:methyl-accepting chemotaxis protein